MKRIDFEWLREAVMSAACSGMNRMTDCFDEFEAFGLLWLHGRIQDLLSWIFDIAYDGSKQELAFAIGGEIPPKHWSERQREFMAVFPNLPCHCVSPGCRWAGPLPDAGECPDCGGTVFLDVDARIDLYGGGMNSSSHHVKP